jgi:hypothetical protein
MASVVHLIKSKVEGDFKSFLRLTAQVNEIVKCWIKTIYIFEVKTVKRK